MKTEEMFEKLVHLYQEKRIEWVARCRYVLSPHEFLEFWEMADHSCRHTQLEKSAVEFQRKTTGKLDPRITTNAHYCQQCGKETQELWFSEHYAAFCRECFMGINPSMKCL